MSKVRRGALNEVVPGKVYQRGQILTWKRPQKVVLLEDNNIGMVANFWPKLDPDMSDMLHWYLYLPVPHSDDMVCDDVDMAAEFVAWWLEENDDLAFLSLCEAGKTRSVFFAALVTHHLLGIDLVDAYDKVVKAVPKHRMRKSMVEYLTSCPT